MFIQRMREQEEKERKERKEDSKESQSTTTDRSLFSAYQGKEYTEQEIEDALFDYGTWIYVKKHESQQDLIEAAIEKVEDGEVVAWFQGKSGRSLVRIISN